MASTKKKTTTSKQEQKSEEKFKCCRCGKEYTKQKGNFSFSQSPLFQGNNGRLPICDTCVNEVWDDAVDTYLGNEKKALKYLCMKFDIYYNEACWEAAKKSTSNRSLIKAYISKTNLLQYQGKTYDTTLQEEQNNLIDEESKDKILDDDENSISKEVLHRWGQGYTLEEYEYLEGRYEEWTTNNKCDTVSEKSAFINICLAELNIKRAMRGAGDIDKAFASYNKLTDSANVQPKQSANEKDAINSDERYCIGTIIEEWEKHDPIINKKEHEDVDNIKKTVVTWFLGHMARMLGIDRRMTPEYEEAMEKYTVSQTEYDDDEDEEISSSVYNKLFDSSAGSTGNDNT